MYFCNAKILRTEIFDFGFSTWNNFYNKKYLSLHNIVGAAFCRP